MHIRTRSNRRLIIAATVAGLLTLLAATARGQTPCVVMVSATDSLVVPRTAQPTTIVASCLGVRLQTPVTWSSSNTARATVNASTGLVTAVSSGSVDIVAKAGRAIGGHTISIASPPPPVATVASVTLTPSGASIVVGATTQFAAVARSSTGTALTSTPLTWTTSAPSVATVSPTGAVRGNAPGSVAVLATAPNGVSGSASVNVAAPPPPPVPVDTTPTPVPPVDTTHPPAPAPNPSGTADPTQLPTATLNMAMNVAAYQALGVASKPAGWSYRDPVTNVRITKLTSATFPASSANWWHDYFEGGYEVSLPYTGDGVTRAVLAFNGSHYLLDVNPGVSVSRGRTLSGSLDPNADLSFTFSNNPATPYYAFVLNGSTLRRFDLRTMAEAPGNGFPLSNAGSRGVWLHQCANDAEFVWMYGSTIYDYTPATGRLITLVDGNVNEPRIDRGCGNVGLSMNSPDNGLRLWNTTTNTVTWSSNGSQPFAHHASLQHLWLSSDWNNNWPFAFTTVTPTPNSWHTEWGPSIGPAATGSGGWIQPGDQRNAYSLWNSYGSLAGNAGWTSVNWTAPGGMVLVTANGDRRLLAHPYSNQSSYWDSAWPKLSADGKAVLFTSDMIGSRYDLFLAEPPTKP